MNTHQADYIRHRLARFRAVIASTRHNWPACSPFSDCPAAAPYYERAGILQLLESPGCDPAAREELSALFLHACGELASLEQDLGSAYGERLGRDLRLYIDAYAATVCHAHLGRPDDGQYGQYLRDMIGAIVVATGGDGMRRGTPDLLDSLDRLRSAANHLSVRSLMPAPADTCSSAPEEFAHQRTAGSLPAEQ